MFPIKDLLVYYKYIYKTNQDHRNMEKRQKIRNVLLGKTKSMYRIITENTFNTNW